jgi:hypothetical protein
MLHGEGTRSEELAIRVRGISGADQASTDLLSTSRDRACLFTKRRKVGFPFCVAMRDWTPLYGNYPPSLTPAQEEYLVQSVKDWSAQHGLTVRPPPSFVSKEADPHTVLATNAPVTLFPSPFPKSCFDRASQIQAIYNELYAAIANDEEWLDGIVREYEEFPHLAACHFCL